MELQLANKIALVSGSTAGIGLAIATTLAQEGATAGQTHLVNNIDSISTSPEQIALIVAY